MLGCGRSALVGVNGALSAQIYRDEILQHHVVPLISVSGGSFQHDNARLHTVRVYIDFLPQNNVPVLPWPADLSPIEHLSDILDRRVRQKNSLPHTLQELGFTE